MENEFNTKLSTVSSSMTPTGIPIIVPNITKDFDLHYISFNNYDTSLYDGHITTAVVDNNMYKFIVLNGDHRKALDGLSLQDAIDYVTKNSDQLNSKSSPVYGPEFFPWSIGK